jgi:DNA mismatch repair protein MSH4
LAIKKGRHPIRSISIDSFVPNDTYASMEANLVFITGPNMSGKSTYLGQICLLSVMAQTGMFVPAEYASFRLCDRIFTRIGSDDNLDANASNFMVEMQQMSLILNNLTENSLVIIDELGRGTSASDGLSISFAICNYLLNRNSFIFFATHFTKLYKYFANNLNVINLQLNVCMENTVGNPHINYLYTVSDGVCKVENYGIQAAQMAGLDTCITLRALEISKLVNSF